MAQQVLQGAGIPRRNWSQGTPGNDGDKGQKGELGPQGNTGPRVLWVLKVMLDPKVQWEQLDQQDPG